MIAKSAQNLDSCREDLIDLQKMVLSEAEVVTSQNDIIVGVIWLVRAIAYDFSYAGEVCPADTSLTTDCIVSQQQLSPLKMASKL